METDSEACFGQCAGCYRQLEEFEATPHDDDLLLCEECSSSSSDNSPPTLKPTIDSFSTSINITPEHLAKCKLFMRDTSMTLAERIAMRDEYLRGVRQEQQYIHAAEFKPLSGIDFINAQARENEKKYRRCPERLYHFNSVCNHKGIPILEYLANIAIEAASDCDKISFPNSPSARRFEEEWKLYEELFPLEDWLKERAQVAKVNLKNIVEAVKTAEAPPKIEKAKEEKVFGFTLTSNETDKRKFAGVQAAMEQAAYRILHQQTVPVKEGQAYLEYNKNGCPHIHCWYITATASGGQIFAKVFQRLWNKAWHEDVNPDKCRFGWHEKVRDVERYKAYCSVEQRLVCEKKNEA